MVKMYLFSLTDLFESYPIHYSDQSGSFCSRCSYNQCPSKFGCLVPENFDIEVNCDNFTIVCDTKIDLIKWRESSDFKQLKSNNESPTLGQCLNSFIDPEELEDDTVYCQKCQKNTGATKVRF